MQDKTKWALVLGVCLIAVISALIVGLVGGEEAPEERPRVIPRVKPGPTLVRRPEPSAETEENTDNAEGEKEPPEPEDEMRVKVRQLWRQLDRETDSEEAARLLRDIGNIYGGNLGEYDQAAACYQELLRQYPQYTMRHGVYYALINAYEQLEEWTELRRAYLEMLEEFPPGSPEHQWALDGLGIRDWDPQTTGAEMEQQIATLPSEEEAQEQAASEGEDEGEREGDETVEDPPAVE